jgi:hypothetical protein
MPYIQKEDREPYDYLVDKLAFELNCSEQQAGDLNYVISRLCWSLCGHSPENYQNALKVGERRYAQMNEILGALEAAKLELYRRIVSPYEDEKIEENGDV